MSGGLLRVWVQGIGLLGPGLDDWTSASAGWRASQAHVSRPTLLPPPARLPPAERRRAGATVKLALAVADQAVAHAGIDPGELATVFTSSSGEGTHCHALCETLASPAPMVSPTRFTNSVHNAPSGCWHIAVGSRASSTSLSAFDASFGAGLLDAAVNVRRSRRPVLLVATDSPYPEPLHSARPLPDHFGIALVLVPVASARSLASLDIAMVHGMAGERRGVGDGDAAGERLDAPLDALCRAIPAARGLPLLMALARLQSTTRRVELGYLPGSRLQIDVNAVAGEHWAVT